MSQTHSTGDRQNADQPIAFVAASWPNADTLRAAAQCWIVIAGAYYIYDLLTQTKQGLTNGLGRPFGDDFINYWSAAKLASQQRASEIYDFNAFNAFHETITGAWVGYNASVGDISFYHYSYPPVLILLTLPLAAIPFAPALFVWLATSWYAFYRALRLALPDGAMILALATPAVFLNAMAGQNGMWTAALLCGGLCLLERRPAAAGILFGLLIFKPHLALLIPIALLAGRHWQAIAAAALTVVVALVASVFAFGMEIWSDYFRNLAFLRQVIMEDGPGIWHRMVSVFFAARRLGAGVEFAYAIQVTSALTAATLVALAWARQTPAHIRNSMLVLGTWLATPYLMDYDLVAGGFVVAWLFAPAETLHRFPRPALIASALVLVLPIASAPVGKLTGLSVGAFFLIPAFLIVAAMSSAGEPRFARS